MTHKNHKMPRLGSGERFKMVEESARKGGAKNPAAVAAAAGIKKYGQKKMTAMAQKGKRSSHFARALKQHGG